MRTLFLMLACASCCAPADAQPTRPTTGNGDSSTAAAGPSGGRYVATITGRVGIAVVDRDKVELRDRTVYVNGRSFGRVPEVCEIRYVVSKEGATLYVVGQPRAAPAPRR
ncbi:hypothetical protein ACFFTM_13980 [Pseudoduganella plicata]|nr:hypothetical protein [Pseudoduganella plicata]QBQ35523.1 hypothetical protein E1742_04605 [Pseudoduganella plicata]